MYIYIYIFICIFNKHFLDFFMKTWGFDMKRLAYKKPYFSSIISQLFVETVIK